MNKYMNSGNAMVEVLVALGIATIVLAAIVSTSLTALTNSESSNTQNVSTNYAQQALEVVRKLRDTDYTTYLAKVNGTGLSANYTYCLDKDSTTLRGPVTGTISTICASVPLGYTGPNIDSTYVRTVNLEKNSTSCVPNIAATPTGTPARPTKVTITIAWKDGKCQDENNLYCRQQNITSCMSNYYVLPTP